MKGKILAFTIALLCFVGISAKTDPVVKVSLITCGPGNDIYELEGHTALRLQYADGRDISVNWGTFDFNSPNFLYRFVKGETDYRMAVMPFKLFLYQYGEEQRSMRERDLNLTFDEMQRLHHLIDSTLHQGSPVYRYNYVKDNCATRPIDYLAMATRQPVVLGEDTGLPPESRTFRDDMRHYHADYPWYQFGIDLALGSGIDYRLENREHAFAPTALDRMLDKAYIQGADGTQRQLVADSRVLIPSDVHVPLGPTPWYLTPLFWAIVYLLVTAWMCWHDWTHRTITLWFGSVYYSLAFLAGLLLTFLIFVSVHEATSPNWIYLWLNPFCLIGAAGVWLKNLKTTVFYWQIVNFVAIITLGILALCRVQSLNPAFIPLIVADGLLSLLWILSNKWERK